MTREKKVEKPGNNRQPLPKKKNGLKKEEITLIKPKRGPGRPPNESKKKQRPRSGIASHPGNKDNSVEFDYAVPTVFKKLYAIYKAYNITDITVTFDKTEIILEAQSFSDKTTIKTIIDCSRLHHYYCAEKSKILLPYKFSSLIIGRIDPKYYDTIMLIRKKGDSEISNLIMMLNNPHNESTSYHRVNVSDKHKEKDDNDWDETKYPINFKLSDKDFKKIVNDIHAISPIVIIEKVGKRPLKFKYVSEGNTINGFDVFKNEQKIDLHSTIKDKDILAATIKLEEVRPLSNAQVAESVRLYVDKEKKLMVKVNMDNGTAITKVLISIEDYREND